LIFSLLGLKFLVPVVTKSINIAPLVHLILFHAQATYLLMLTIAQHLYLIFLHLSS